MWFPDRYITLTLTLNPQLAGDATGYCFCKRYQTNTDLRVKYLNLKPSKDSRCVLWLSSRYFTLSSSRYFLMSRRARLPYQVHISQGSWSIEEWSGHDWTSLLADTIEARACSAVSCMAYGREECLSGKAQCGGGVCSCTVCYSNRPPICPWSLQVSVRIVGLELVSEREASIFLIRFIVILPVREFPSYLYRKAHDVFATWQVPHPFQLWT